MKLKIIFLTLLCLSFSKSIYAQKRLISGDEFRSAIEKAEKISGVFPRRHIIKEIFYENGKILKIVDFLWEAMSSENYRIIKTEKSNDNMKKYEEIRVGLDVFKRENDAGWKKEDWEFNHGLVEQDIQIIGCSEFTKELVGENQNTLSLNYFSIGKDNSGLNYDEETFLIGETGFLIKKDFFKGQLNPRNVKWHQTFIYEYDPNIKIEAPIK